VAKVLITGTKRLPRRSAGRMQELFRYPSRRRTRSRSTCPAACPVGGTFIQAESELAAISMVYGAAAVGERAMTSSSSPGISSCRRRFRSWRLELRR